MSKKIIIVLIIIIVLLISGGVGYFVWNNQSQKVKVYQIDPGEYFITNVCESKCLIKADLIIETTNKKTSEYLNKNQVKMRDAIIKILRSKKYDEIMRADIQEVLKENIIQDLQNEYQLEGIDNVYFSEFVVQQ